MATEAVGVGNQAAEDLRLSRQLQAEQDSFEAYVRWRVAGGEKQSLIAANGGTRETFMAFVGSQVWGSRLDRPDFGMAIGSSEFRDRREFQVVSMRFLHHLARVAGMEWPEAAQHSLVSLIERAAERAQAGEPQPATGASGEPAAGKVSSDASPDAEERALAVLAKYQDLTTITAVAEKVGCTREHLSRNCPRFKAAFSALKKTRQPSRIVRGSKSKDGNLEAWSNDEIDDD